MRLGPYALQAESRSLAVPIPDSLDHSILDSVHRLPPLRSPYGGDGTGDQQVTAAVRPRRGPRIAKRLGAKTGDMTTATIAEMETRHHWFRRLDAEHRSWINLVARAGIDGFVELVRRSRSVPPTTSEVFGSAPRELARKISLHQTVELVRTTIDVVESQIDEVMPRPDRPILHAAIVQYSREVAFGAAEIYARAAELRGAVGRPAGGVGGRRRAPRRNRRDGALPRLDSGLDLRRPRSWSWWAAHRQRTRTPSWKPSGTPPRSPASTCSARCRATG